MTLLFNDNEIVERVLTHIAQRTTDVGQDVWREPVDNYRSQQRFDAEMSKVLRRSFSPFCPSAALPKPGSFVARDAAATPLLAVRGKDGVARAFHNVCRHRGMRLATGQGCSKGFVCGYHGWTYGLDGRLLHIPHEAGFPDVGKASHGLAALPTIERHGLVFVSQDPQASESELAGLPEFFRSGQSLCGVNHSTTDANWKIILEGFIEGYHIRATHPKSFLPYGFDNLNLVEKFGRHSRVTFPFQRIAKLAEKPAAQRNALGFVTFVYHLFPNVLVTVLSSHTNLIVLEPISVDRTGVWVFTLTNDASGSQEGLEAARRDIEFVGNSGAIEDREVVTAIQRGISSDANSHFVFGKFESAIVHFHRTLDAALSSP